MEVLELSCGHESFIHSFIHSFSCFLALGQSVVPDARTRLSLTEWQPAEDRLVGR